MARQKLVLDQITGLNAATGDLIARTSEQLKIQGAQIHEQGAPGWTIWTGGAPGGESVDDMTVRVDRAVEVVSERLDSPDVVVVSHGHFSRSFVCRFLGWPVSLGIAIDLRPAGAALLMEFGGPADRRLCTLVGPEGAAATRSSL